MQDFEDQLWKVRLPETWWVEPSDDCTTMSHPDGIGALQIFTYQKEGEVERADLDVLAAQEMAAGIIMSDCRLGEFHGFSGASDEDGQYWKVWFVCAADCALCITYNCDSEDQSDEAGVVQQILYSLKQVL